MLVTSCNSHTFGKVFATHCYYAAL